MKRKFKICERIISSMWTNGFQVQFCEKASFGKYDLFHLVGINFNFISFLWSQ